MDGNQVELAELGPGDFFGEMAKNTSDKKRTATVEANEPVEVIRIDTRVVDRLKRMDDFRALKEQHAKERKLGQDKAVSRHAASVLGNGSSEQGMSTVKELLEKKGIQPEDELVTKMLLRLGQKIEKRRATGFDTPAAQARAMLGALINDYIAGAGNIAKGMNVRHEDVNSVIREAFERGKATLVRKAGFISTLKGLFSRSSKSDTDALEQAVEILKRAGYTNLAQMLDTYDLYIIEDVDMLKADMDSHQALHSGLYRNNIYMGRGLFERLKKSPVALAQALAHETYEISSWNGLYRQAVNNGRYPRTRTISEFRDDMARMQPGVAERIHGSAERTEQLIEQAMRGQQVQGPTLLDREIALLTAQNVLARTGREGLTLALRYYRNPSGFTDADNAKAWETGSRTFSRKQV